MVLIETSISDTITQAHPLSGLPVLKHFTRTARLIDIQDGIAQQPASEYDGRPAQPGQQPERVTPTRIDSLFVSGCPFATYIDQQLLYLDQWGEVSSDSNRLAIGCLLADNVTSNGQSVIMHYHHRRTT